MNPTSVREGSGSIGGLGAIENQPSSSGAVGNQFPLASVVIDGVALLIMLLIAMFKNSTRVVEEVSEEWGIFKSLGRGRLLLFTSA
jgi:hypothetical protein